MLFPCGGKQRPLVQGNRATTRNARTDLREKIMDGMVPLGGRLYFFFLMLLLVSRGADFLSTWIATPNMVLEGNPLAKRLGWKWGSLINLVLCGAFAAWPLAAIIIGTTSLLGAARNLPSACLTRSVRV